MASERMRVAIVCDLIEENWPSMELVADMLFQHLESSAARLRPPLQPHFTGLPFLGRQSLSYNADRLVNRFVDYPRWLKRQAADYDLFHVVDHSYSQLVHYLPPTRTVVTCHDLDTFRCLLDPERERRPRWFRAMTSRILSGFKKAAHVIAVSAATRDEILMHRLMPPDRVSVVPNGVHPSCSPVPNAVADAELRKLLPAVDSNAVWLLNVGSTMPRKRLDVLLRVFASVRRELPDARLLRVGGPLTPVQSQLARELGVESAMVNLPSLSRPVLAAAYRRADLLVHTSEAEGFGLPLIEAMACGLPVVASDLPVLREINGSAAVYCPVADVEAWTEAVVHLLTERTKAVESWDLRRTGCIANAGRFSWSETARQTAAVYRKILL
jgi:glycosyltransferase involved in cell wall biosynthesis